MSRNRFAALIYFAGFAASIPGCSGEAPVVTAEIAKAQPGSNGGTAYSIPGDLGFAEVVIERSRPGQPVTLAVYFLDSTAKKAMTTEPAEVRAKLVIPVEDAPLDVKLSLKPKASGKSEGIRFASVPGNFDYDELRGELFVRLDGKEVIVPFAFR